MTMLFANNAVSKLAVTALLADTSMQVLTGEGARFPAVPDGDFFYITVQNGTLFEIMRCTARSGDVLTVTRAQDGTSAQTWSAGSSVEMRLTASILDGLLQEDVALQYYVLKNQPITLPAAPTDPMHAATKQYIDQQVATLMANANKLTFNHMIGALQAVAGFSTPAGWLECGGQSIARATYSGLLASLTQVTNIWTTAGQPWVSTTGIWPAHIGTWIEAAGFPHGTTVVAYHPTDNRYAQLSVNCAATLTNIPCRIFWYGPGNGTTHFNLPDYRGRAIIGTNILGGVHGGPLAGIAYLSQADRYGGQIGNPHSQSHNHGITDPGHAHSGTALTGGGHAHDLWQHRANDGSLRTWSYVDGNVAIGGQYSGTEGGGDHTHAVSVSAAGSNISVSLNGLGNQENMPPSSAERILIYSGVG